MPRRAVTTLAAVALALGVVALGSPTATAGTLPTAPVVTPSTTATVVVGTPMTMTIQPGPDSGEVVGYAWTWLPLFSAPVYSSQPSCDDTGAGGIHFVCGSSVTVEVAPVDAFARFSVWAFDAAGHASRATAIQVNSVTATPASLDRVTHQWTTDQFGALPAPSDCGPGGSTVLCVADTAGADAESPNGAFPLTLPRGVTWDDSGSWDGVVGVLNFGPDGKKPMHSDPGVVDTAQSFTVAGWLTPTAAAGSTPETAISGRGPAGTGFELRLTTDQKWEFRVHGSETGQSVVQSGTAGTGFPLYIAGVWDAVNHELRLSFNGGQAAIVRYRPEPVPAPETTVTIGSRLDRHRAVDRFTGQIGNPVVVQAALPPLQQQQLMWGSFFPGADADLN